jgi:hypothetical protein
LRKQVRKEGGTERGKQVVSCGEAGKRRKFQGQKEHRIALKPQSEGRDGDAAKGCGDVVIGPKGGG